jgi:hypothetical protein
MIAQTDTRRGNLSFYLGGKALSDRETDVKHGSGPSDSQICNSYRAAQHRARDRKR